MAVVVLGNAVGLAANVAAAVHSQRAADAASTASALFAANRTQLAREYESSSQSEIQLAVSTAALQSFCEVAVLLLIVAAFVVAEVACAVPSVPSALFALSVFSVFYLLNAI